jgi:hypothetical protein
MISEDPYPLVTPEVVVVINNVRECNVDMGVMVRVVVGHLWLLPYSWRPRPMFGTVP